MQMQFYADDRDIIKWSVILDLANIYSIHDILYVAMMQKDDLSNQGKKRTGTIPAILNCSNDVIKTVTDFFNIENNYTSLKCINRIKKISSKHKIKVID